MTDVTGVVTAHLSGGVDEHRAHDSEVHGGATVSAPPLGQRHRRRRGRHQGQDSGGVGAGLVLDVGPGCSDLPRLLIDLCRQQRHHLLLCDSAEMLAHLPDEPNLL